MAWTNITNGTLPDADEVMGNFNQVVALNSVGDVYEDQTGGTIASSTTETKIAEKKIDGGSITSGGVLVIASGKSTVAQTDPYTTVTMRLRTGTSSTATNNTIRKTITRNGANTGTNATFVLGWTIVFALTAEEDWEDDVYIHITGQNAVVSAGFYVTCESLVVIPIISKT